MSSPAQNAPTRSSFTLLEVAAIAAGATLLVLVVAGSVFSILKTNRERQIRRNLQTVWVAANQYFLEHQAEEVPLEKLRLFDAPGAVRVGDLKAVADEDYMTVNDGKIRRGDAELKVASNKAGTAFVTYKTANLK